MFCGLPMPCHDCEVEMNTPSLDAPRTPTKLTANDGAGADNHNDSTESENSSDSDLPPTKQKTRRTPLDYVLIKEWVTGEKAVMDEEDIKHEMFNAARDFMSASLLRKLPNIFRNQPIIICGSLSEIGLRSVLSVV